MGATIEMRNAYLRSANFPEMKTNSLYMLVCVYVWAASVSLTTFSDKVDTVGVAGKYGVTAYSEAPKQHISLELTLDPDHTFRYIDNTNPENKLDVSGKWTEMEGDIYLTDYPQGISNHKIWKTEKDCPCLKSRKGMTFYRLCKI